VEARRSEYPLPCRHVLPGAGCADSRCPSRRMTLNVSRVNAARRHGVSGVDGQVQDDRLNLSWIDQGGPEVRCQRHSQLYRPAKSSFQQKRHPGYLVVEIDLPRLQLLLAREGEEFGGEIGAALSSGANKCDRRSPGLCDNRRPLFSTMQLSRLLKSCATLTRSARSHRAVAVAGPRPRPTIAARSESAAACWPPPTRGFELQPGGRVFPRYACET
jgi:hypothetical protein